MFVVVSRNYRFHWCFNLIWKLFDKLNDEKLALLIFVNPVMLYSPTPGDPLSSYFLGIIKFLWEKFPLWRRAAVPITPIFGFVACTFYGSAMWLIGTFISFLAETINLRAVPMENFGLEFLKASMTGPISYYPTPGLGSLIGL